MQAKPLGNIGKGTESITSGNSKQFTLLDLASMETIKSNMESITASAQSLKEALGSEVTSGLMTQINEMLSKKDELQNLANILNVNQEALGKAAKATGSKNKNAVSEEYYSKNYQRMYESGISELKSQYPDSDIVGPQIKQLESGMVKFSASIRSANGEWKKLSATINKDGTLSYPEPKGMTPAASVSAEKAFQNIKAGKLDPKNFLNFDQTEAYAQKLNQIFEEAYGKTDKYTAKVEADGQAVISKALPNGEEITVMQARVDDVKQIISEYEKVAGDAVKVKELVEKSVSSVSAKVSPANQKSTTTSSTPKETTSKYTTDKSFTGDLKLLTDTEAEQQIIDKYIMNTNKMVNAFTQRREALDRINKKTPQNTTEQNALDKYNSTKDNIANNIKTYDTQIQKAVDSFRELQSAKSGIQGIDDVFASGEKNITEWAAAVVKGKMSIEEFEKKVNGL
ncbi:MAG TPA: hypothetical protein DCW90_16165, partial [Lachnospiraceae bacterium]|nr:hypothetical protein [Lachnospiraceae bacterium]